MTKFTPKFGWPIVEDSDVVKQYPATIDDPFKTALETDLTFVSGVGAAANSGWTLTDNFSAYLPTVGLVVLHLAFMPTAEVDMGNGPTVGTIPPELCPVITQTFPGMTYYAHNPTRTAIGSTGNIRIYGDVGHMLNDGQYALVACTYQTIVGAV